MKPLILLSALLISLTAGAQTHGVYYGTHPSTVGMMDASKVQAFMGNKVRISTTLRGKVVKVTNTKGGWFELEAGNGKMIDAHFKMANVNIPMSLAGHYVIAEGVVAKQLEASDKQHFAGDSKAEQKQPGNLTFEVAGLVVDK